MESQQVFDILDKAVKIMYVNGVEYADALYQSTDGVVVSKKKTREDISTPTAPFGLALRVFKGGEWREASTYEVNEKEVMKLAGRLPDFTPTTTRPVKMKTYDPWKMDKELPVKINLNDVPLEDKMRFVREAYDLATGVDERVIDVTSILTNIIYEKIIVTSEGTRLRQVIPIVHTGVRSFVREAGRVEDMYQTIGFTGGWELTKRMTEEKIREIVEEAIEKLKSTQAPSGSFDVILDPGMTGLFSHEAFGHGTEADQVARDRSYLIPFIGKEMGKGFVSLVDNGSFKNGWGSFYFDDEGTPSQETYIIENGVLKRFLQDRFTASLLEKTPTGNARRESPAKKEHIRMTNTYIEPGDWTLEEMLEGFDGILVKGFSHGMEDPLGGELQIGGQKGHLYENGKKIKVLSSIAMSGYVPDVIANIDALSKVEELEMRSGRCGKGSEDFVFTGSGGPYTRTKVLVGPG